VRRGCVAAETVGTRSGDGASLYGRRTRLVRVRPSLVIRNARPGDEDRDGTDRRLTARQHAARNCSDIRVSLAFATERSGDEMMKEYFMSATTACRQNYEVEAVLYTTRRHLLVECARQISLSPIRPPFLAQPKTSGVGVC